MIQIKFISPSIGVESEVLQRCPRLRRTSQVTSFMLQLCLKKHNFYNLKSTILSRIFFSNKSDEDYGETDKNGRRQLGLG